MGGSPMVNLYCNSFLRGTFSCIFGKPLLLHCQKGHFLLTYNMYPTPIILSKPNKVAIKSLRATLDQSCQAHTHTNTHMHTQYIYTVYIYTECVCVRKLKGCQKTLDSGVFSQWFFHF